MGLINKNMKKFLVFLLAAVGTFAASSPDVGLRPATSWAANNIMDETGPAGVRNNIGSVKIVNMVTDYGADNTGASDCGVILQSAVTANAAGTLYYFPEGTYKFTTPVDINKSIRISAPSRDLVTITNARGTENAIFRVNNSAGTDSLIAITALGAITTLTTNALPGDEYLSVANNASLVPNTKYLLWSTNTAYSNNGYYPAEIITIRTNSTGSTNLTYVVGDLHREYNLGETSISDLPAVIDMTVENITFRGGNTPPSGVGNKVLAGALFSSLKFKGCRFMDIGVNLGNVTYSDDVVFEDCAFRGYGRLISNAGYAFSLSMVTRPKVLNCTFRDLQMQMWIDCTAGLVSDCSGWNVACPVQFHGGNRGCVLQNITLANVNSTDGSSIAYQNYGCVYKNIHHTNPRSTGFVLQNETNCVLSNLSVTWPAGKDGDPASYSASGMLLTRCENVFIDGFTTLGAQASATVQLVGGTGKLYLRGVRHQGSGGTGYLLANVTTVTAHEVVLDNCHSGNRLVNDMTGGFPSITIRNATCAQSIDTACGLSHTEPNNILELSGIFGGTQASYLSPLFNNRGGMTARKPSDNSAQYGFYVTEIFPGRGAGQVVRWHTYTNNAQTQVTNSLPHDSRVVRSGQQFTIINGDAAVTMNGSKAEGVAVFETGIGELYKFPTNTQNRWITVEYRGSTNYWPGTSNNWKIVAASPELGIFSKVGTVTISADGTVTNTFAPPFLSGVTPIISVTPTVSTGGTNYFVSSADNTKFLMTGPIGVTFNWSASGSGR